MKKAQPVRRTWHQVGEEAQFSQVPDHGKKMGGAHSQTIPHYICLCSLICTYSNAAINEALFHVWIHIEIVRVDPGQK